MTACRAEDSNKVVFIGVLLKPDQTVARCSESYALVSMLAVAGGCMYRDVGHGSKSCQRLL